MNAPITHEGWQAWDLALRGAGQLRVASGKAAAVIGFDMSAMMALGSALGVSPRVVADLVGEIEPVMIRKINERMGEDG